MFLENFGAAQSLPFDERAHIMFPLSVGVWIDGENVFRKDMISKGSSSSCLVLFARLLDMLVLMMHHGDLVAGVLIWQDKFGRACLFTLTHAMFL
jgi:hypothetical protein